MTLVELAIAMSIMGILTLMVADFYANRLIDYNRNFTQTILQSNTKQAIDTMERDIRASTGVEQNSTWPDANSPGGIPWVSDSATPSTVVLSVPSRNNSGGLIYNDPATHNSVKTDDVVYFVGTGNALYRRLIANPDPTNAAKTTCPQASASSSCPADAKVVEDVASLLAVYFDTNNVMTATPSQAYSIQITLKQSRISFGRTFSNSLTSQATLRNRP
jgi:type II secretory pathway component PulJ